MTPTLVVLAVLVLVVVGVVVWAARRKPAAPPATPPHDTDTAWNDPVTPASARRAVADVPPASEPRP